MASSHHGGPNRGNNVSGEQRNKKQQPATASPETPPKSSPTNDGRGDPNPKSYEKTIATWTKVLGASTVVLAIATGISAYFLHSTDDTIAKQLESNRIQLRAYVGFDQFQSVGVEVADPTDTTQTAKIKGTNIIVSFRNFGPTPALNASPWVSIKWYAAGIEPDFSKSEGNLAEKSEGSIAPGQIATVGSVFVSQTDLQKTLVSNGNVFIWGQIDYRDSFPNTEPHTFHFCYVVAGSGQNTVNAPVPLVFRAYKPECNRTS